MINRKRKKNKILKNFFSILVLLLFIPLTSSANEIKCKKFDVVCKSKQFLNETKEFQKKGFEDGKNQLKKSKDKIIKAL